jgi:hypothetical protein
VVSGTLGVAIDAGQVRAVAVTRGRVTWAGEAEYASHADLAEVLARLAAERPARVRTVRIALGAALADRKVVEGMPRLAARDLARHVALQPRRYFLANGVPLVTDAVPFGRGNRNGHRPALIAAAPEPLLDAIAAGVRAAGLTPEAIAPAADFSGEESGDPLGPLRHLGDAGARYAIAYAAATGLPRLLLLPASMRERNMRDEALNGRRWMIAGALALALGALSYVVALIHQRSAAEAELLRLRQDVTSALAARADLDHITDALAFLGHAEERRTHHAALLARVTAALPDSAFLAAFRVDPDGRGMLAGYAPRAAEVVAALEHVRGLSQPALEGPVTREVQGSREWDRFSVRFRVGGRP